ncbi:MAG: NAD(P)/FAD-dependent oxidoreductase [Planctomycetaceae bacterium]|jgi:menaquinone-9 beta-reductase|nr:NAD(P)/FAD-dependent oxidoreductase [Planctomycetaceae bacterium]MBT6157196.1 NAD(P)/FAD-dependent oxidoreductase [Planctomycetaceae bacterium]MBT6486977.1 NAD(P)/FAD-dependent oxidoreductase [Planctomycetaceae bacterium]MBT6497173.1 NAD(P)/FAD-dependent oxidoreductase [Planctomycetaceae bacterium]
MDRCDVLIVGGGPAGSTCAGKLRQAGVDVLVIDKQVFPRDKTCAGWVTPPVLEELALDPTEYANGRVCQPITGFRTGTIGGKEVETSYERVISYGIRRCEFDHYLLECCGARTRLGEAVKTIERSSDGWLINDQIETKLLVGAGGHFCPIARSLSGRKNRQAWTVGAQEIEFEVPANQLDKVHVDPKVPQLFFCADLKGYGWCFRKGNFLNIGLGRVRPEQLSRHVAEFCEFLRSSGKLDVEIPARMHGHAYQLYEGRPPELLDDGVLLIGDAAGLAYPQSGEGIRPAVESGLMAAAVIANANGNYRRDSLLPYRDQITARFGTPRTSGAAGWLPAGWLQALAGRLLKTEWFNRSVVLDKWFLHADTDALVV